MKTIWKFFAVALAAIALDAGAATAGSGPAATNSGAAKSEPTISDLLPDDVIARGKGFEIKRSKLDQAMVNARANARARGQEIPAAQVPLLELRSLDYLILVQMLNHAATADDKAKGQEESQKMFETLKKRAASEEAMSRQLKAAGLTEETFKSGLAEEATAKAVLASKVTVTDADIKKFYDDNPDKFENPEQISVSFITLGGPDPTMGVPLSDDMKKAKRKQLQDLRDRAKQGEDFAALAKQYSEDTVSRENGGKISIYRGMQGMPPEFEETAFKLQTNEISDVITTQYGYHILKMNERVPAKKADLADVKADIKSYLETQEIQKILPKYEAQLRKDSNVEILDDKLKVLDEATAAESARQDSTKPADSKPASK